MKKNKQLFLLFILAVTFVFSGYSQNFVPVNKNNTGQNVLIAKDQVLEVKLPSTPSTGYGWYIKDKSRLSCISQIGQESFESDDKENSMGASGTSTIRFIPTAKGTCELELVYQRPWESNSQIENYKVQVSCEGSYTGNYAPVEEAEPLIEQTEATNKTSALPASFSWKSKCTPIKNQGSCGSCWAFAITATFEASVNIWDRSNPDFSEQFLVNCYTGANGCGGGGNGGFSMYVKQGAVKEADLPYKAKNGACGTYTHREKAISYKTITNTVANIQKYMYDYGPIYTGICAGTNLRNVGTGILTKSDGTSLNHAVVLIGWDDAGGYWLMANSWGTRFGDKGYCKVKYGVSGIGGASAYVNYKGIIPHNPTSIADLDDINLLTISPNPSEGKFTMTGLKEGNKVEIYDVIGKKVYEYLSNGSLHSIDLNNQNKGVYLYRVIDTKTYKAVQGKLIVN